MKLFYNLIKNKFMDKKILLFIVIGIINTINHNIIYILLLPYIHYYIANIFAFITSLFISYILNSTITFKVKMTYQKFIKFPITYIPNIIMQMIGIGLLVELFNVKKELSAFLASIIAIPFTFIVMKYILKE